MNGNRQQFFTRRELANYLRISTETLDLWARKGVIKPLHLQGSVRYSREEVDRFLKTGEEK